MTTETTTAPATEAPATAPAKAPRKTGKKAAAVKAAKRTDGKLALKTLCAQLKIEPKAARRKLRAAKLSFHDHRDRWFFTEAQAARVREVLRPN